MMVTTPDNLTDTPKGANDSLPATTPNAADIEINPTGAKARAAFKDAAGKVSDHASGLKDQAADKARDYAAIGKDKAASGLESVTRLMDDAAGTIDEKVGEQYGDYARKAASAVANVATSLRGKDVDELLDDARTAVRKSPALAIGAAVAVGFVLARLFKAGKDGGTSDDKTA